ncbi:MAG TPA: hypothetical protein PKK49_13815, partial [Flavobacteriales bacterium]|nr:hypothetical protein [Flavobacteriales bacterium]
MRGVVLLGVVLGLQPGVQAQLRNANWFFNSTNLLSYASGAPVASTAGPLIGGSTAGLSDPQGNALMYAVGNAVLNREMNPMSGSPSLNNATANQGYLFLPVPGDPSGSVVFHNRGINFSSTLSYGYLDMDLDNGSGGFVGGMTVLASDATCKLTAVPHANGQDYWVLTQVYGTDAIAAYRLHAGGLDAVPVISHTGVPMTVVIDGIEQAQNEGIMAASRAGDRLAMAGIVSQSIEAHDLAHSRFEILHFDNAAGIATHLASIPLPVGSTIDGIEFSPDGTKLYFTSTAAQQIPFTFTIHQYNVTAGDEQAIIASHTEVLSLEGMSNSYTPDIQLALAPDGRIWFDHWTDSPWLGVIDAPNEAGMACTPIGEYLLLPNNAGVGLPNQCKRYHDSDLNTGAAPEPVMG